MSRPIIEVRDLSKRYRLGAIGATSFREEFHRYLDRWRGVPHPDEKEFWAVRDVSFDVAEGEIVGVIGRNGAGKSTLLKILSRITEPTSGSAILRGRVASLLEVGTGFHPELTGRENVYLNGAILGMSRAEVRRKFDEIVAFAEVDQFIDTPVKRYSSGMYVRLAFAVAAHLEPEILIVDEVLAVGDAQFQTKCIGKLDGAARRGATVLFVSHQLGTVNRLCSRCLLMSHGNLALSASTTEAVARYLDLGNVTIATGLNEGLRAKDHPFTFRGAEIIGAEGIPTAHLSNNHAFRVRIHYELHAPMENLRVGFRLQTFDGTIVLSTTDLDEANSLLRQRPAGRYTSEVEFPAHFLNQGRYAIWLGIDIPMRCAVLSVEQAAQFVVEGVEGALGGVADQRLGVVAPLLPWRTLPSSL